MAMAMAMKPACGYGRGGSKEMMTTTTTSLTRCFLSPRARRIAKKLHGSCLGQHYEGIYFKAHAGVRAANMMKCRSETSNGSSSSTADEGGGSGKDSWTSSNEAVNTSSFSFEGFSDSSAFGELLTSTQQDVLDIGSLIRVTGDTRVWHISGAGKEGFSLKGCEGVVVDRADQYKGRETTANLPYKVKLEVLSPKNGKIKKVFVHLAKYELETIKTVLNSEDERE